MTQTAAPADPDATPEPALPVRLVHVSALTASKLADGLVDPKLVLAWLMGALGAPAALTGALVPVREAGSLLPQLALAGRVSRAPRRATLWSLGAAGQALGILGIGLAALLLEGAAAGVAILACLAGLAVCRALCSLSQKDALARTVPRTRRGRITGLAGSLGAAGVLAFSAALAAGIVPQTVEAMAVVVLAGAGLMALAAAIYTRLPEPREAGEPGDGPALGLRTILDTLRGDAQLRRFVAARAALTPTAYALPFLVLAAGGENAGPGGLGALMLASAVASILSAGLWGRLADRSSRLAMALGGIVAALALGLAALATGATGGLGMLAPGLVFAAQAGYEGVRQGRKIHLTDMATDETRALYSALSNTLIGAVLVAGAAFGLVADVLGLPFLLAILATLCIGGTALALGLEPVQRRGRDDG